MFDSLLTVGISDGDEPCILALAEMSKEENLKGSTTSLIVRDAAGLKCSTIRRSRKHILY